MKQFWNERYDQETYCYGTNPNLFFSQSLLKFSSGKILLPAEGEGRNAVYAAQKNWEVEAFDWSESGRSKALKLAKANAVSINYKVLSFEEMDYNINSFDAIGLIYVHLAPNEREQMHKKMVSYLKENGVLILEAFEKKHIDFNSKNEKAGGPKDVNLLFSKEELLKDFEDLEILLLEEKELLLNEGAYHCGQSSVIRLIAKKLK